MTSSERLEDNELVVDIVQKPIAIENRKTGNNVIVFNGDFGLGGVKNTDRFTSVTDLKLKYSVTGSFDNATKVLTFKGQRSAS
jgi:hypothetical protein